MQNSCGNGLSAAGLSSKEGKTYSYVMQLSNTTELGCTFTERKYLYVKGPKIVFYG